MVDIALKELVDDASEIRELIEKSRRTNVKAKLIEYVKELEDQISKKRTVLKSAENSSSTVVKRTYEIKNYAWDQSDKFVKIYLTLTGAEAVSADDLKSNFTDRSLLISVSLADKNYEFGMKNLLHEIIPAESSCKAKKDSVVLMLRKKNSTNWTVLTQTEQQLKERQDSKLKSTPAGEKDPGDGLMNIMKQMYETGDDEMKRTIAKAWTESRDKQTTGGF